MIKKQAFSIAEVLTALTIVALIMAATAPILIKSKTVPQEAPWKYVSLGELSQNAAVYGATDNIAVAVFGDKKIPIDQNVASAQQKTVFTTKINPKISVVARNRAFNPLISRHLIDFYEKDASDEDKFDSIGKISFDNFYNLALGNNALDSIKTPQSAELGSSGNLWTNPPGSLKGALNTAVGQYAMGGDKKNLSSTTPNRNMEGHSNTAVGAFAMRRNTTGNQNTAAGAYALESATDTDTGKGSDNVAVGYTALRKNTGNYNIAVGSRSMASNTTGEQNTAVGYNTLYNNTTASTNVAFGSEALFYNQTAQRLTAIGYRALYKKKETGDDNTANTAIGYKALHGPEADDTYITGEKNVAVGSSALHENTTGGSNVAVGSSALHGNTTGEKNVAVGSLALESTTGSSNVAIGYNTLKKTTKNGNNAIGVSALENNTNGTYNIAIGKDALSQNTTGNYNTAVGYQALSANTTGSHNIAIGRYAAGGADSSNKIYISANASNVGQQALIYGDDSNRKLVFNVTGGQAYLAKYGTSSIENYRIVKMSELRQRVASLEPVDDSDIWKIAYSDIRLKNVIGDSTAGLNEILQIKVKNFTMKNDKSKEPKVGVIAQDLQKVFPKSVFKGADGYLRIKRDEIFYACVNAIKELHAIIQDVVTKIAALDEKVTETEKQNQLIAKKISAIKEQNKLLEAELSALEN